MMTFTHIGRRGFTGGHSAYRVTADARRKPGKMHALILHDAQRLTYRALCGEMISADNGDSFAPNVVKPAGEGRVTCKRCLKRLEG